MKKKCIKKKKAPSYAFGIEQIAANIQPIGDVTGNIGTAISTNANDTSKGAVAGAAFGGLGKGASMGAQLGSVAGPMGTAIGGAVGAVGGLLGGIFTGRKKRLAALKRQRQQAQTNETMAALGNQAEMEQEYWNDNGLAYSFENGGVLPNMAWVDNNEIIRDNAGNLIKVPDNKPGTDNHLINSTHLDSVLSDKLKRPGTNKTFAQEGEKLTKMTKGSKGKDRFAKASDELNKLHANQMYNTLLSEQAAVKAKKGIKPEVKGVAPAYEVGKEDVWSSSDWQVHPGYGQYGRTKHIRGTGMPLDTNGKAVATDYVSPYEKAVKNEGGLDKPANISVPNEGTKRFESAKNDIIPQIPQATYENVMNKSGENLWYYGGSIPAFDNFEVVGKNLKKEKQAALADRANYYMSLFPGQIPAEYLTALQMAANSTPVDGITGETIPVGTGQTNTTTSAGSTKRESKRTPAATTPAITKSIGQLKTISPEIGFGKPRLQTKSNAVDLPTINTKLQEQKAKNILADKAAALDKLNLSPKFEFDPSIATLAAGMFNQPEYESQVYNPYAGAVNRALARRRINIEPTLAANRRSRAISNRNLANLSPNTGANLAARTQSAVSEYAQNADLYANRDNANNQYLADAANMMNNLGQQFAQNAVYTNDVNARNRAAARSARNRSIESYNKWYQNKQLMKNQMERDKALYPLLKDYLSYGIKNELLTGLDTRYGK